MNASAFAGASDSQHQSLNTLHIHLDSFCSVGLLQLAAGPQFLTITDHEELRLRVIVIELVIDPNERDEVIVRSIQLKLDLGIRRHADAFFKVSAAGDQTAAVEVAIQLGLPPSGSQPHGIEIGNKNLRRLDLFQRKRDLRFLVAQPPVLPYRSHAPGVSSIWIEAAQREDLRLCKANDRSIQRDLITRSR